MNIFKVCKKLSILSGKCQHFNHWINVIFIFAAKLLCAFWVALFRYSLQQLQERMRMKWGEGGDAQTWAKYGKLSEISMQVTNVGDCFSDEFAEFIIPLLKKNEFFIA